VKVTDPVVTGLPALSTVAVIVTGVPVVAGFSEDVTVVVVTAPVPGVMSRHQTADGQGVPTPPL